MSKIFFEQFDDGLVHTLKSTGRGIHTIGSRIDSILNSPITQLASVSNPEFGIPIYAGLKAGNSILKGVGAVSNGLSDIFDRKRYDKQNAQKVVKNVLERVGKTVVDVIDSGIKFV